MKNFAFSVITILYCLPILGQDYSCRSLVKRIKKDSEWNAIHYFREIDKALLENNCDNKSKATLLLIKGDYYSNVQQFEKAISITDQAEKYLNSNFESDSIRAVIALRKAGYFAQENQYFEAYREWLKCNNYYLLHNNSEGLSYTQQVLGMIYLSLNEKNSARQALTKASKYAYIDKNPKVLNRLYMSLSHYWGSTGNYDSSLYYLRLSENYSQLKKIDLSADYNKGVIYFSMGDVENARLYFQKTINDSYKVNCKGYVGIGKYGLGNTYIGEDEKLAFKYMKEA